MSRTSGFVVVGRALLAGFLVSVCGSVPWSILLAANVRRPAVPWAPLVMTVYLFALWRYLSGWGWPPSSRGARRRDLRALPLPARTWVWALLAGAAAILTLLEARVLLGRFVRLPQDSARELSRLPMATAIGLVLGTALVAAVAEEAAFRGFLQAPLERQFGRGIAVVTSSLLFGLAHLSGNTGASLALVPWLVAAGAVYGSLAAFTGSILPGMVLHFAQDSLVVFLIWGLGDVGPHRLVGEGGVDLRLGLQFLALGVFGAGTGWAYRGLGRSIRGAVVGTHPAAPGSTNLVGTGLP